MFDQMTAILRVYIRVFVSQGVGVIGLAWCLAARQTAFATVLTGLVLVDQVVFLRSPATRSGIPHRRVLDNCCLVLSGAAVLIGLSALVRGLGLRETASGSPANTPADCIAFVLATFVHNTTTLTPATPEGRLLGAVIGALGVLAILAGLAVAVRVRRGD